MLPEVLDQLEGLGARVMNLVKYEHQWLGFRISFQEPHHALACSLDDPRRIIVVALVERAVGERETDKVTGQVGDFIGRGTPDRSPHGFEQTLPCGLALQLLGNVEARTDHAAEE